MSKLKVRVAVLSRFLEVIMFARLCILPALLAFASISGCLVSSDSHVTYSGKHVSSDDLARIVPGKTTEAEATQILGSPSFTAIIDPETRELRWNGTRREHSSGAVFLLFHTDNTTEKRESIGLAVKNGVVTGIRTE
jgi:hypothetical protein